MTGIEEYNYPAFITAGKQLEQFGYHVFNPAHNDELHDGERFSQDYTWYMRQDFYMILRANGIALLPGWENSKGAAKEIQLAQWLELDIRPIDMWMGEEE